MARKKLKKSGLRRTLLIAAVVVAGVILVVSYAGKRSRRAVGYRTVSIYVASPDGLSLKAKRMRIKRAGAGKEMEESIKVLIKTSGGAIPRGTHLRGIRVSEGTAFVNLSRELRAGHPGGTTGEMLTVYSIVNTVALNFPGIKRVQILVEGRRLATLKGHMDISRPLRPNMEIIEYSRGARKKV